MRYVYIMIPSKDRSGNAIPRTVRASVIGAIERQFAKHFGGFTAINGLGGWIDDAGALMSERVTRVEAFTGDATDAQVAEVATACVNVILTRMNQASVMTGTFNGSAHFHS